MALDAGNDSPPERLPPGTRVACVVSGYHRELTDAMLDSARRELLERGLAPHDLIVVAVPGAFEIPLVARRLAVREDVDAVLTLGLVLKGETRHDEYVARAAAEGISRAAFEADKPVAFGVLTCDTLEQARARALPAERGGGGQDKGREVARAVVAQLAALRAAVTAGGAPAAVGFGGARRALDGEAR